MISNNIVGYCFPKETVKGVFPFDTGEFFKRIFLFDRVYLRSSQLNDIGHIVRCIGPDQVIELLKSGAIKILLDGVFMASCGQTARLGRPAKKPLLPLGSYSFCTFSRRFDKNSMSQLLANVRPEGYCIQKKTFKKLKLAVVDNMIKEPEEITFLSNSSIRSDIKNNIECIRHLIAKNISCKKGINNFDESNIVTETVEISEGDHEVKTNLNKLLGIDKKEEHEIVQSALLSLATFNMILSEMKVFDAMPVFTDFEICLFERKYNLFSKDVIEDYSIHQLDKIVQLNGLPDFSQVGSGCKINIEKLLEVKKTEEFLLFREFLKNSNKLSDKELTNIFCSLKSKISNASSSLLGKSARVLFGTGIGAIPGIGLPLGAVYSAIDQFFFEKIMPSNGAISFIKNGYSRILKQ
ncbi:MAG: hypothetical protein WGN25_02835 [Candidatus Electrothrix sp. GW3-4]|uniref:hypothetical protein n=1 Tax=Candidatus Electrothrix sp. GW3-4 TaxID=3126740 RepID=UPI0030CF5D14